jgi:hypothetical protein
MIYLKVVSLWLSNYIQSTKSLKEKRLRYKQLENISPEQINLTHEKLSGTNKLYNPTENKAIALAELKGDIERLENNKEFIDYAITKLKPIEKSVIEHRYINHECLTWSDISKRVQRTERQCISIRNRAIEKIERELF